MAWNWPVISTITKKLFPDKEPVKPVPPPVPDNIPAVDDITPAPPVPEPGFLNSVNYLRALLILRNTPFKKLWAEFLKLPLKKLAFICGLFIWAYMTYNLSAQILLWLFK